MTGEDRTTPRPWRHDDTRDDDVWVTASDGGVLASVAGLPNAALIVTAVNNYDRLRAIEDAARALLAFYDQGGGMAYPDPWNALRAALTGDTP